MLFLHTDETMVLNI